jgi:hypothetical protein
MVLGESVNYPRGVLERVRSIVDSVIADKFKALKYQFALRIETETQARLVDLETALLQVEKRQFSASGSLTSSTDSFGSLLVAIDCDDANMQVCQPWHIPEEVDTEFDVYISHSEADSVFARQLFDCFAKFNTTAGASVRVFLKNVSLAHIAELAAPVSSIRSSCVFVPVISMDAIAACGALGSEYIPRPVDTWSGTYECFATALTIAVFISNLILVEQLWRCSSPHTNLFIGSMLAPRALNIVCLSYMLFQENRTNVRLAPWLLKNKTAFSVVSTLAILRIDNLGLLQSRLLLGKYIFTAPPPIPLGVSNWVQAFGILSTLVGDAVQFYVAFMRAGADDACHDATGTTAGGMSLSLVDHSQLIVSALAILHQVINRALALLLSTVPHTYQNALDEITDTEQLLECMVVTELRGPNCDTYHQHSVVLPLILDEACVDADFSSCPLPANVVEHFQKLRPQFQAKNRFKASNQALRTQSSGAVLTEILRSGPVVRLWRELRAGTGKWDRCEEAAAAITAVLDNELAQATSAVADAREMLDTASNANVNANAGFGLRGRQQQ